MKILGIDYGKKKLGLAVSEGKLALPFKVIRCSSVNDCLKKITDLAGEEEIEVIVLGISEGRMAEESRSFGDALAENLKIPVHFQDETLSTHEAKSLSIEAGIGRKKRKSFEDAYSAALILQRFIDLGLLPKE